MLGLCCGWVVLFLGLVLELFSLFVLFLIFFVFSVGAFLCFVVSVVCVVCWSLVVWLLMVVSLHGPTASIVTFLGQSKPGLVVPFNLRCRLE